MINELTDHTSVTTLKHILDFYFDQLNINSDLLKAQLQLKANHPNVTLTKLPGDASTRHYYRMNWLDQTFVVMKTEPFTDQDQAFPFLAMQNFLNTHQISVPQIIYSDSVRGVIVLEDLGDDTLIKKLVDVTGEIGELEIFKQAINMLVKLHALPAPGLDTMPVGDLDKKFDLDKLLWEVDHTIENLFKHYLGRVFEPNDVRVMLGGFVELCKILADQNMVVTHRDFHSRNIMVTTDNATGSERYAMIDFQDARLGARQYDLASLLKDSYYQLSEVQIQNLLDYYINEVQKSENIVLDKNEFKRIFDLMAVQRNFKAIGTFASIMNKRGDEKYLKYIGNTFENIRRTLIKYPEFSALRQVLCKYYYF